MKKTKFSTTRLCRAGVIAALYTSLTYAFGALSYQGFFQIRPAEALCILPLFYVEAIPALYVGCMLSNLTSPFFMYDVFLGSLATLLAAVVTYMVGVFVKNEKGKLLIGGLPPVLFNALIIPLIIVFLCDGATTDSVWTSYLLYAASLFVTECVWVYALGTPFYAFVRRMRQKNVSVFLDR